MKLASVAMAIAAIFPACAIAGGPARTQGEAVVAATAPTAVPQDWSGFYGGVTVGRVMNGTTTYVYSGVPGDSYDMSGSGAGVFAGYNLQNNAFVYGIELAAQSVSYGAENVSQSEFTSMIDLKLRGGLSVGRALPYAFVGYSSGKWENNNGLTNSPATGVNYGVGVDFAVANAWFAGAEYIRRNTSTDFNENDNGVEPEFGTLQLRLGYRF
jgi:opacity protein-like surface antigen